MEYLPTKRDLRRTLLYVAMGVPAGLLAEQLLVLERPLGFAIQSGTVFLGVLLSFTAYRNTRKYGFDRSGLYRMGRQEFHWIEVERVGFSFEEHEGSVTLVPLPSIRSVLSGPMLERAAWVDYGAAIVFRLNDGRVVKVDSNLDRLTRNRTIEHLRDLASDANPHIQFD